ncbi:MAG: hypothetical protein ACFCU7_02375 [Pleurocapsa sp.]
MKKTSPKNIQRQIANLIPLIELCLAFGKEANKAQAKLNALPAKMERLKKQAELLEDEMSAQGYPDLPIVEGKRFGSASRSPVEETELELDFLVNDLDKVLVDLTGFKYQISNLIVLRERVEALQEERLENITPERIDKLLAKQHQQKLWPETSSQQPSNNHRLQKLWQKIAGDRRYHKLATSTAIVGGLIFCLSAVSYTSMKYQIIERGNIEQSQELDDSSADM